MDLTPCKSFQKEELEITRNPFDSREFDKENLPVFSPSIFVVSGCRSSEKKNKSFRWSIDQIAALKPAEIDEFPNQEYSASYDREEDEVAAQNAINEYFSKVTLPSPWTRNNKEHPFKRVTFSPHPPTYFKEKSYDSANSSSANGSQNESGKKFVDGSCQTTLTIPPSFDLEKFLGDKFVSYTEEEKSSNSKELNISTLRRKLFSQGDLSPTRANNHQADVNNNFKHGSKSTSSTPRTPRTPNWITSSPFRGCTPQQGVPSDNESVLQSSFLGDPLSSPVLSPIKGADDDDIAGSFTRLDSPDTSFDFSISSITHSTSRAEKLVSSDLEMSPNHREKKSVAFHMSGRNVEMISVEPSDSLVDVKESTRVAPMEIPGFSPIKHEDDMDFSVVSTSKYDYDIQYNGNSVKESTANHIHGITGLFSPIKDGCNSDRGRNNDKKENPEAVNESECENDEIEADSVYDDGPLDITDLSMPYERDDSKEHKESESSSSSADDVFDSHVVVVSPYPTPKRGILKHSSQRGKDLTASAKYRYEHRLENIEDKISRVENKIESVKSSYEQDIREIKKTITPAKKLSNIGKIFESPSTYSRMCLNNSSKEGSNIDTNNSFMRGSDFKSNGARKPLGDRTNLKLVGHPEDRSLKMDDDSKRQIVVSKGYSALNRAKKVQRKIDNDFELCIDANSKERQIPSVDDDALESEEVANILKMTPEQRLTREGHRISFIEEKVGYNTLESKFKDYRLQAIRESLNDSWDLRSRGTMDVAEMDNSVLSMNHVESSTPTPIMDLAGLSIYTAQKEHRIPCSIPKPIPIDRRWIIESGKIERRHTWPNMKPIRSYSNRSVSPTFMVRSRTPRGYSFTKQDVVNKIKEEWRIRPPSRTNAYSVSR